MAAETGERISILLLQQQQQEWAGTALDLPTKELNN